MPSIDIRVLREGLARCVDPEAWGVLEGTIPQLPMDRKERDRFEVWKESSLRKADNMIAGPLADLLKDRS